jgi:hypothetical protein
VLVHTLWNLAHQGYAFGIHRLQDAACANLGPVDTGRATMGPDESGGWRRFFYEKTTRLLQILSCYAASFCTFFRRPELHRLVSAG